MKYIRIKNNGIINPKALHLVGASTKRNDSSKIGQFGSGNKFAMAYLLRNGYEMLVTAGLNEIKIHTEKEVFRDQEFEIIFIDGEKTSITTEMGKDWLFWQAVREIYCNALDEGGCTMDFVQEITPNEKETHFYIENKKDVTSFVQNFDNYFATNKKVLFECEYGRILEKSGNEGNVYRKGIKCLNTNKSSVYDYDFKDLEIDENRLMKYDWMLGKKIWNLIYKCDNEEVIKTILHQCSNNDLLEGNISDFSTPDSSNISNKFKEVLRKTNIAPRGYAGLLKADEVHNHVILPTELFRSVRGVIEDENVGDKFKVTKKGAMFRIIEQGEDALKDHTLKKALEFLKECQFGIDYEIKIVIFDNKNVLGAAYDGEILISEICLEKGINEVVVTLLEEYVHLKYNVKDETRGFQTAMLTEFTTYMKKINAFAI